MSARSRIRIGPPVKWLAKLPDQGYTTIHTRTGESSFRKTLAGLTRRRLYHGRRFFVRGAHGQRSLHPPAAPSPAPDAVQEGNAVAGGLRGHRVSREGLGPVGAEPAGPSP